MNLLSRITCELKDDVTLINEIKYRLDILYKRPSNNITQEIILLINEALDNGLSALLWQKNISLVIASAGVMLRDQHTVARIEEIVVILEETAHTLRSNITDDSFGEVEVK